METIASPERRELAYRHNDGIEVTLFWHQAANRVTITVLDTQADAALEFEVDGSAALDAFNHPYAYAALPHVRGVETPPIPRRLVA